MLGSRISTVESTDWAHISRLAVGREGSVLWKEFILSHAQLGHDLQTDAAAAAL